MHFLIVPLVALVLGLGVAGGAAFAEEPLRVAQADLPDAPAEETEPPPPPPPAPRGEAIEEIVVRAGESEAVADLQSADSVTGFDASDLEALGAQSIDDLAGFTPNLEIVTTGATTPTFFIRGVGLNDFAANSSGSVAVYTDEVPKNSPALQLPTLFDVEAVNVLRGPQGTGPFRSASAGAIKIYSRKPTGDYGAFLRSEIGNYDYRDFEGGVQMPLYEDILSSRFAFRFSQRDGFMKNRCGDALPRDQRPVFENRFGQVNNDLIHLITPEVVDEVQQLTGQILPVGASVCGEPVFNRGSFDLNTAEPFPLPGDPQGLGRRSDGISYMPTGLPTWVNDLGNWATRGTFRFQPTLDQDWVLIGNFAKRNEYSTLGQSIGTDVEHFICDFESNDPIARNRCRVDQTLGGPDSLGYQPIEVLSALKTLNPCVPNILTHRFVDICPPGTAAGITNEVKRQVQASLGDLDDNPYEGDFNRVGRTKNDVWGASLNGNIALGNSLQLHTVTGYDTYDRSISQDLDFSPSQLFELDTEDEGWQVAQSLELSGVLADLPVTWNVGGFLLKENLQATTLIDLYRSVAALAVRQREWEQDLLSVAGYAGFEWGFWDDFTLDGGVRYNWEKKEIDLTTLSTSEFRQNDFQESDIWQSPTGQIRLTYRFREDTHAYWKFSRGWKGGHYNVTVSAQRGISGAEPESINAFETGLAGSWFNGRVGFDASLFHYDYENYQIFTVVIPLVGSPEFVVLNANDATVYGGEADISARPFAGAFVRARFAWLESKFEDFVQTAAQTIDEGTGQSRQIIKEIDNSGNRLLNSPQFTVSLTAEQTIPLGRFGSLIARWDGRWTATTYYDATEGSGLGTFDEKIFLPEDTIGQEAFWLHNFNLSYRTPDGSVTVGAWVRNATDEVYKTFAFDASGLEVNRTTVYFVGEPRMWGGSLTVLF